MKISTPPERSFEIWTSLGKGSWRQDLTEMTLVDWHKFPNAFAISEDDYED